MEWGEGTDNRSCIYDACNLSPMVTCKFSDLREPNANRVRRFRSPGHSSFFTDHDVYPGTLPGQSLEFNVTPQLLEDIKQAQREIELETMVCLFPCMHLNLSSRSSIGSFSCSGDGYRDPTRATQKRHALKLQPLYIVFIGYLSTILAHNPLKIVVLTHKNLYLSLGGPLPDPLQYMVMANHARYI